MWAKTFHKLYFDLFENRQKTERIETFTKEAQLKHIVLSPCRFCSGKPNLVFPFMFTISAKVHFGDQFAIRNRLMGMFLDHYFFSWACLISPELSSGAPWTTKVCGLLTSHHLSFNLIYSFIHLKDLVCARHSTCGIQNTTRPLT